MQEVLSVIWSCSFLGGYIYVTLNVFDKVYVYRDNNDFKCTMSIIIYM